MSEVQNSPNDQAGPRGSAWRQIAGGLLGGVIVLATVLGSIILAMQETPVKPTAVAIASPTLVQVTPPPSATPVPSLTPEPATPIQPTATPTAAICDIPPGWTAYTVRAGDTLASIARAFSTDELSLIQGNCLSETDLTAGQTLYLPPPPTRGPTPIPTPCGPPRGWIIYRIQPGDTLYGLSVRYRTTVYALALANCLTTYTLRVGQPLYVPPTPVVTFTPRPTFTPLPTLTPQPTPSATLRASDTPQPTIAPSDTPLPSATFTPGPSATPTLYPTDTPVPTWTPQPTDTLLPTSTSTPEPTSLPPSPTDTPLPPTATHTPGPSATPLP